MCLQDDLLVPHPYFILMAVVITGKEYYEALLISFPFSLLREFSYKVSVHSPISPAQISLITSINTTEYYPSTIRYPAPPPAPAHPPPTQKHKPKPIHNTAATITISRFSPLMLSYPFFSIYILSTPASAVRLDRTVKPPTNGSTAFPTS